MWKWRDKKPDQREYGSLEVGEKIEMKGRALSEEQPAFVQQPSTAMSAAIDRTIAKEKEDLTINSPEELINQNSEEALSVAQKWSAQLERKSSFIKQEEISTILQEATADIEYWMSQKEKINKSLSKDGMEENKRNLFLILIAATNQAIGRAQEVAEYYVTLLPESLRNQASVPAPLSLPVINPLIVSWASDSRSQQLGQLENHKTKITKIPSKQCPLTADTLKEVLETWSSNAEVRYDSSIRKYVSNQFQPNKILDFMRCTVGRNSQERQRNRDAIEKVALEGGIDGATRFKNHFSIRVKNVFGIPLTPELIKKVQKDLRREDVLSTRNARIYSSGLSAFTQFVEGIATCWESFQRSRSAHMQYQEIREDR